MGNFPLSDVRFPPIFLRGSNILSIGLAVKEESPSMVRPIFLELRTPHINLDPVPEFPKYR